MSPKRQRQTTETISEISCHFWALGKSFRFPSTANPPFINPCLVPERIQDTAAGVLAAAIVHAKRSLVVSTATALANDQSSPVQQISAWTNLDFEKVHCDYAHFGMGSVGSRCCDALDRRRQGGLGMRRVGEPDGAL